MVNYLKSVLRQGKKIYRFFEGCHTAILVVTGVTLVYTFLESIGIVTLIPLFHEISSAGDPASSRISRWVESFFQFLGIRQSAENLLILILLLFLFKGVTHALARYLRSRFAHRYQRDLRNRMIEGLFRTNWEYFINQKSGALIKDTIGSPGQAGLMLIILFQTLVNIITSLMYILFAFYISVPVTLLALGVVGIISLGLLPISIWVRRQGEIQVQSHRDLVDHVHQFLAIFKQIKSNTIQEEVTEHAREEVNRLFNAQMYAKILHHVTAVGIELSAEISVVCFLYISSALMEIGIAETGVIALLLWRVIHNANSLKDIQKIAERIPHLEVVSERDQAYRSHAESSSRSTTPYCLTDSIQFDQISYRYPDQQGESARTSLQDVSLTIPRGTLTGIVGVSGSGKTTLVDLLLGLLQPENGSIIIDGTPLEKMDLGAWRKSIGYVPQKASLINDTILNNIRLYRDLSREQVEEAARLAQAHQFIMEKPEGYETVAGEEGVKLSGGEKQRIALAGALAGSPEILILDEATSELDSMSEQQILEPLQEMIGEKTLIFISHRISSVLKANRVFVLQSGRIVEQGTPEELLRAEGTFRSLYEQQSDGAGT